METTAFYFTYLKDSLVIDFDYEETHFFVRIDLNSDKDRTKVKEAFDNEITLDKSIFVLHLPTSDLFAGRQYIIRLKDIAAVFTMSDKKMYE